MASVSAASQKTFVSRRGPLDGGGQGVTAFGPVRYWHVENQNPEKRSFAPALQTLGIPFPGGQRRVFPCNLLTE